jgi:hypothetical protein
MAPWNLASTVYPIARPGVRVTNDPVGALWIAPDGSVRPVRLADVTTSTDPGCLTATDGRVDVVAPPGAAAVTPPLLVTLEHRTEGPVQILLTLGPEARGFLPPVTVEGTGTVALPVAISGTDGVQVQVVGPGRACLTDVRLTRPE